MQLQLLKLALIEVAAELVSVLLQTNELLLVFFGLRF